MRSPAGTTRPTTARRRRCAPSSAATSRPRSARRRTRASTYWSARRRRPSRSRWALASTTRSRCTPPTSARCPRAWPASRRSPCRAGCQRACRSGSRSWRRPSPTIAATGSPPRWRPPSPPTVVTAASSTSWPPAPRRRERRHERRTQGGLGPDGVRRPGRDRGLGRHRPPRLRRLHRPRRTDRHRRPRHRPYRVQGRPHPVSTDKLVDFDEVLSRYEPVIGLETHVELGTASKMFCGCSTTFGAEPNTQTCPVCLGLPGALPVANAAAIEATIRIGLALGCRIATWCRFARKNYFYPDIPKGFQTSQYDEPLCTAGHLDVEVDGETYRIEIERVHLEEDTGKNLHVGGSTGRIHGADHSLIDYNRAGIPLVEIVTRPIPGTGVKAPEVARAYVTELREILLTLGVSEVRMEQGNLRCDVNTSLAPIGALEGGTRSETKNVNSLRSVERAVRFEMRRQAAVLDAGGRVLQETRHFHEDTGSTSPGRSKEEATDYRYFPEPDLVPIAPDPEWVEKLTAAPPELPAARRARLQEEWQLSATEMAWIANAGAVDLVAGTVAAGASPADARKWWLGELARRANDEGVELTELSITPGQVAELAGLVSAGTINDQLARQALDGVLAGEGDPAAVVEARGLAVLGESDELVAAVEAAIAGAPDVVEKVRGGKVQALGALVGQVMKATKGKADAPTVKRMLEERVLG